MSSIKSRGSHSAPPDSNVVDIITLLNEISRRKYYILAFTLLIAMSTLGLVTIIPPKWEISALINIGRTDGVLIEPADRVVEMIKQRSFSSAVMDIVDGDLGTAGRLFSDTLTAKSLASGELIEIRFQAPSQAVAQQLIVATSKYIKQIHEKVSTPKVEGVSKSILEMEKRLKELNSQRDRLVKLKRIPSESNMDAIEGMLLEMLISDRNKDILSLMGGKAELEAKLGPDLTYATRLMDGVNVQPATPRKETVVTMATIIGLFLAVFGTLLLQSFRNSKHPQFGNANEMAVCDSNKPEL